MTRWRQRMGAERLEVLLPESLEVAVKSAAIDVKDLAKVIVDTTVQKGDHIPDRCQADEPGA